jgi:hypothetical protein
LGHLWAGCSDGFFSPSGRHSVRRIPPTQRTSYQNAHSNADRHADRNSNLNSDADANGYTHTDVVPARSAASDYHYAHPNADTYSHADRDQS